MRRDDDRDDEYDRPRKKDHALLIVLLAAGGVVALVCGGFLALAFLGVRVFPAPRPASAPEVRPAEDSLATVSAVQLAAEYKANEVAADAQYLGQRIRVTGVVIAVERDVRGEIHVDLASDGLANFPRVECYFAGSWAERVAGLRPGDRVTITGRCAGKRFNVRVEDCELSN